MIHANRVPSLSDLRSELPHSVVPDALVLCSRDSFYLRMGLIVVSIYSPYVRKMVFLGYNPLDRQSLSAGFVRYCQFLFFGWLVL